MDLFPEHATQSQSKAQRKEDCLNRVLAYIGSVCHFCVRDPASDQAFSTTSLNFSAFASVAACKLPAGLICGLHRVLRIARFVHIRILLFWSQGDFGAQRRLGLTKIRREAVRQMSRTRNSRYDDARSRQESFGPKFRLGLLG
jgi:hypothetical protein